MINLILFSIKIVYAGIIGGALHYTPNKPINNKKILETALVCIFSAAVLSYATQLSHYTKFNAIGFSILAVSIIILVITQKFLLYDRIIILFASLIGMIIGSGYFIQSIVLGIIIYLIMQNSELLLDYILNNHEKIDSNDIESKNINN